MIAIIIIISPIMIAKNISNVANNCQRISGPMHIRFNPTNSPSLTVGLVVSVLSSASSSDGFGLTPASRGSENGARVRPKRLSSFLDSSKSLYNSLLDESNCKGSARIAARICNHLRRAQRSALQYSCCACRVNAAPDLMKENGSGGLTSMR